MDNTPPAAEPVPSSATRHILFVSTDATEIAGVESGLADMRPKWEVEFIQAPAEATESLGRTKFDAVVVDLLLPGQAGVRLLKDVMELAPEAVRLGLTSAPERQAIQQVGAPAHQLLLKPCDPKVLKAVLARAFASQDFLAHEQFKKLVSNITSLPVLPQSYTELMQELKSEEPSLERAGQIVARDAGLSAKILQLVNSAFFGLGRAIAHPSEAAMFLGSETLKALVLTLQVFSQFNQIRLKEFNVENVWKHSWATGVLAKRLCEFEEADRAVTDEAFLAGLLHDVGKLVLAANYPSRLEATIRQARDNKITFWEQEYRDYGASHAELGGYLLGVWGLPSGVVEAVAFHHRPAQARRQTFSALTAVHAANTIGKLEPSPCDLMHQPVDVDYLRSLGLAERVEGWQKFFEESLNRKS
jgi:HD-like signal output (HDOD) protein